MLQKLINGEEVDSISLLQMAGQKSKSGNSRSKFDSEKFRIHFAHLISFVNEKWFDIIIDGIDADPLLIRINPHNKEFGIRKNGKKDFKKLNNATFYDKLFDETYDRKHSSWLIRKSFKDFCDVDKELTNDLDNFLHQVNIEKNKKH